MQLPSLANWGLRYLWIDSLCIVEKYPGSDPNTDWEIEASRMATLYSIAHLTIVVDLADHSDEDSFASVADSVISQQIGYVVRIKRDKGIRFDKCSRSLRPTSDELRLYRIDLPSRPDNMTIYRKSIDPALAEIQWTCVTA